MKLEGNEIPSDKCRSWHGKC